MTIQGGNSANAGTNGITAPADTSNSDVSSSMTDLLPPEIVAAVNKNKSTEVAKEPAKEPEKVQAKQDKAPEDAAKDITVNSDEPPADDIDISDIDSIIAGKQPAKADDAPEVPDWHETDEYKNLLKKVGFVNGVKNEDFDKVIKAVVDKKIVESETYKNGLEEKITKAKQTEENLKSEIERLKNIEKDAFFDSLEDTRTKYGDPMSAAARDLAKILEINDVKADINKVLLAKNLTEFTNLIKDSNMDEQDLTQARTLWRSYNESLRDYNAAKADARTNLKKHMSSNIPEETVKKIMGNTVAEAMKKDPRFEYIKNGISQDEYPKEVTEVLSRAQNNFANIAGALSNPIDSSRNGAWLNSLAAYTLDASHNAHEASKVPTLLQEKAKLESDLKKLAVAHTKLMNSAKGINGANGISRGATSNGANSSDDAQTKEQKAAELKKIIDGTGDVSKFMGFE